MKKYAFIEPITPNSQKSFFNPWILLGGKFYNSINEIPLDHIIVTYHYPGWLDPIKQWVDRGGKYIEIEYGYWGDIDKKGRVQTKRVTYQNFHNINMKPVPYSRAHLLYPSIHNWQKERGDHLLIPMPNNEFLFKRKGITLSDWKNDITNMIKPYWDGPVLWREKRGAKGGRRSQTFREQLKQSFAVVGERTMACSEAVLLGYPAYTIDDTMVTPLMGKDLSILKNPILPNRQEWIEHLAWSQFHVDEFQNKAEVALMVEEYQIN